MEKKTRLQHIPSVNFLLEELSESYKNIQPLYLKRLILTNLDLIRRYPERYGLNKLDKPAFQEYLLNHLKNEIAELTTGTLKKVINATGVVLHTGLGRAPLDEKVSSTFNDVSRYTNLEIDLESGKRGERLDHLSRLLVLLTGAEDGIACNNNAAAVMLMLNSVANKKEVILSRGEMVEIGGSFRLPEVMKASGCRLHEIGTTNRTHLSDYANAINNKTGAILLCHTSNYEIRGFTHRPSVSDIVNLAKEHSIPVIYDLGSGSLIPTDRTGSYNEPQVSEIVEKQVDLVSFSGDKLLGGPQSGLIAGKAAWVKKCRTNHLLRALRLDKMIIKMLQQTLMIYLYKSENDIPDLDTIEALSLASSGLKERSERFIKSLPEDLNADIKVVKSKGKVGSGAFPILDLESYAIQISPGAVKPESFGKKLRQYETPIISYITDNSILIDLRCVSESEEKQIALALESLLANGK